MASFLDPQIKLHLDVSVIDWHWYYGCLFSPNKNVGIHPVLHNSHADYGSEKYPQFANDDRGQHSSTQKNGRYEQSLRQESKKTTVPCLGPIAFDPNKFCKEDAEEKVDCVDNHNDDGNESHPQFAKDGRGQHSSAKKNGRYEGSLRQERKSRTVPCFGPIAFDPNKFCEEDAGEEAECIDNHNDDGNESRPQFAVRDRDHQSSAEKNGRYEQSLRQESNKSRVPCFGSIAFNPKEFCEEDAEADCVDNHNNDGNESHRQLGMDGRGLYSRAQKNERFEESLRQESKTSRVPCFGPNAFDPKEFCQEVVDEEAVCVDNTHNDDGNKSQPQFAIDDRGQHSRAQKNGRYEESLTQQSNKSTVPCFGPTAFDPENFCKEDADEEAECVACIFRVLDEDGDGSVSVDEIMSFLGRLSLEMPREEVQLAVRSVFQKGELEPAGRSLSSCGDEFLNAMEFTEFYRFVFSEQEEVDPVKAEEDATCEAFGMFDQNGDGFISAMELADVLCRLGFMEERDVRCCQSMIESVDYNGDGFVDIHEFRHLITRTTYPPHYCVSAPNKGIV